MNKEDLKNILESHLKWLSGETGGTRANLYGANLVGANLYGANLYGANLYGANLDGANLEKIKAKFSILPDGDIIGWKKINKCIIKLLIPMEAKRVNTLSSRKCRAEFVHVLEINKIEDNTEVSEVIGGHNPNFKYIKGEKIVPDSFNDSVLEECTNGIHFFITKQEALDY